MSSAHDSATTISADVVVIGGGPAGIAAATRASELGMRTALLHREQLPGGQIWRHAQSSPAPRAARRWLGRLGASGARVVGGVSVVDARTSQRDGFELRADKRGRALTVYARRVVLATGARELFIPFPGWTLPGVMGIGGAQALLKSGASFSGKRVVIGGSGALILPVAASLAGSGARLALVAEQTSRASLTRFAFGLWRTPSNIFDAARYRIGFLSAAYRTGTWVTAAHGATQLESVTVTDGRTSWREPADVLCTGYGLVPNTEIARLLGCSVQDGAVTVNGDQVTSCPGVLAAGEATGIAGAPLAIVSGEIAAFTAAGWPAPPALVRRRASLARAAERMRAAFVLRPELLALADDDTIVCRCEDVTLGVVRGMRTAREAKLYARVGMGPCQGRTCAPGLELMFGWRHDTVRSPLEPALVSVLSAHTADPTAAHLSHSSAGEQYR